MIKIIKVSYHRNGVSGIPFYAVLFKDSEVKKSLMIASIFDKYKNNRACCVYSVNELLKENIEFANGNSWRGDYYLNKLWPLLVEYTKENDNTLPFE